MEALIITGRGSWKLLVDRWNHFVRLEENIIGEFSEGDKSSTLHSG